MQPGPAHKAAGVARWWGQKEKRKALEHVKYWLPDSWEHMSFFNNFIKLINIGTISLYTCSVIYLIYLFPVANNK
jgi:hypothetical protein